MNRESFNQIPKIEQRPEDVIKDLDDLRAFDSERLEDFKANDTEAYYRLLEQIGEKEAERYNSIFPIENPAETKPKKEVKKEEDIGYKKERLTNTEWLQQN